MVTVKQPCFSLSISEYKSLIIADFIIFWLTCKNEQQTITHTSLTDKKSKRLTEKEQL